MRIKISLLLSAVILILLAFKSGEIITKTDLIGQYGNCVADEVSDYCINLVSDGSFTLVNFKNDRNNPVSGKWYVDGDKVMLTGFENQTKIPNSWKIEDGGKCLKARQQLQFVRLCSAEKCAQ